VPAKYVIHTKPAQGRFRPVGKLGIVDWREDCSNCHNCVKRGCVYGFYRDEADTLRDEAGYLDYIYQCKGCLNCVQNCTKNILTRVENPEYRRLGDDYFTSEIILSTWFQAETGRIPVSGSGYGGPFSGEGFDSMWTDMSEIVRPTRDGIHGREYISTSVDVGRKLPRLSFRDGRLTVTPPPLIELPMPVLFDVIPSHWQRGHVVEAIVEAAAELGTMAVVADDGGPDCQAALQKAAGHVIPLLESSRPPRPLGEGRGEGTPSSASPSSAARTPLVMVLDGPDVMKVQAALKAQNPDRVVAIRLTATPAAARRTLELARQGAEVIHLVFDQHGREVDSESPRHQRDVLREVHGTLTKAGVRDEVTLVASGGIALAEHMAKAIICGADLIAIDLPLLLALECRLCRECEHDNPCPIVLEELDAALAVKRIINLLGAWHSQLLEVLGAMGIREVRRLRGETGRCMFFEDLERDTFGKLFGERKSS
jgi:ferredoxin